MVPSGMTPISAISPCANGPSSIVKDILLVEQRQTDFELRINDIHLLTDGEIMTVHSACHGRRGVVAAVWVPILLQIRSGMSGLKARLPAYRRQCAPVWALGGSSED